VSADELDRTQHAQERDLAMGGLDRNARRLRKVRAALTRINAGTFGICLDCEKEISMKRLAAMPWTASCIVCQEAGETASQPWYVAEDVVLSPRRLKHLIS
jgi:DnaK suppressor protein